MLTSDKEASLAPAVDALRSTVCTYVRSYLHPIQVQRAPAVTGCGAAMGAKPVSRVTRGGAVITALAAGLSPVTLAYPTLPHPFSVLSQTHSPVIS